MTAPVKGTTDAGRRRAERAAQTRQRIVDAALGLFLENGYHATTVQAIATTARVATATVYQAFGTKSAILSRALEVAIRGDRTAGSLLELPWVAQARAEPNASHRLVLVISRAAEVSVRSGPLKEVLRDAAATEPELAELLTQDHQRRYLTQQTFVEIIDGDGAFRPGLTREQATATLFALVNSDNFRVLSQQLHWTVPDWQHWLVEMLHRQLFGTDLPDAESAGRSARSH